MAPSASGPKAGLDRLQAQGKRVLVRVDFNVPLTPDGVPRDDSRLRAALPTIQELRRGGAAVVLMTHLGRPPGRPVRGLSTRVLVGPLEGLLQAPVAWVDQTSGPEVVRRTKELGPGQVLLLENLRFDPGETRNDPAFAARLAELGDVYVNDAFAAAHRAHASTEGVAHLLPAYAGRLMELELAQLGAVLKDPRRPLMAVVGGSKLSTKLALLGSLLELVDTLCLGGAMAATFLKAADLEVGRSLVEDQFLDRALALVADASKRRVDLRLPRDVVVAEAVDAPASRVRVVAVEDIPADTMILDIGPETISGWEKLVRDAGTVVWNGPLGLYENPLFAKGTERLARAVAASPAHSVTGGGDLQAAIHRLHLSDRLTHVSTGGGATLEFLQGRPLPGVVALPDAEAVASGPRQ